MNEPFFIGETAKKVWELTRQGRHVSEAGKQETVGWHALLLLNEEEAEALGAPAFILWHSNSGFIGVLNFESHEKALEGWVVIITEIARHT